MFYITHTQADDSFLDFKLDFTGQCSNMGKKVNIVLYSKE